VIGINGSQRLILFFILKVLCKEENNTFKIGVVNLRAVTSQNNRLRNSYRYVALLCDLSAVA